MTVELTMQAMYDHFPGLFKERADCLNHLFCTTGNGYDWVDGELVDLEEYQPVNQLKDGKAFQYNKLSVRAEAMYYWKKYAEEHPEQRRSALNSILHERALQELPDDVYYDRPRKERWYFYRGRVELCRPFAHLFDPPDNIKPDWAAAIEECKTLLREDGYDV